MPQVGSCCPPRTLQQVQAFLIIVLCRFADGTVCEAVHFEAGTAQGKRRILKTIVEHLAASKFGAESYRLFGDECEWALELPGVVAPFDAGTNEEASLRAIGAFDQLSKLLRSLQLPLEIAAVHGVSDTFW